MGHNRNVTLTPSGKPLRLFHLVPEVIEALCERQLPNALWELASNTLRGNFIPMRNLTAILHHGEPDEGGFWATCLEVPGANGQGETQEECLSNLADAVKLILELNEEDALRDDPHAMKTSLAVA